ncbi:MAG: DUF1049 domain-containing protein [Bacteroidetes bacterium]|nr:DUF1049 domain-containing protein [Bacteroidota bacterium]MCH8033546.1 DUF1049 domain-containing protein [Bacteroidota bacterium]
MEKNTKLVITIVLLILAAVIIFQNTAPVNLKILFWSFQASLIILLILVLIIGIIIGYVLPKIIGESKTKNSGENS